MDRKFEMGIQTFVDHQIMDLGIVGFSDTSYLIPDIWIPDTGYLDFVILGLGILVPCTKY